MSKHRIYITKKGDTWSQVSHKAYGDPFLYRRIIEANPRVKIAPLLEAGISLRIPLRKVQTINDNQLPPWKR